VTALVIYLVCEPETPALARAAVEGGADIIELGIPFSDPLAEGPTIRLASERALARGMRTGACLECIAETRSLVEVPLVPMTYAAILEAYGYERFAANAAAAGSRSTPRSRGSSSSRRPRARSGSRSAPAPRTAGSTSSA
jgi:tryptophan synthase alpha chain